MTVTFNASAILGRSGIERYARELIRGLARNHLVSDIQLLVDETDSGRTQAVFDDYLGVRAVPCLPPERKYGAPLRRLVRMIRTSRFSRHASTSDLVHLLEPGKIIPRKKPIVTTIHDLFPMYPDMGLDRVLTRRFPKRVAAHLLASDAILCPSHYVAGTLAEFFPHARIPVFVTPLAASEEFRPTKLSDEARQRFAIEKPFVLFVGRIDARKNLHRMLRAWSLLPNSVRQNAEFLVMLAGNTNEVERFQRQNLSVLQDDSIRIIRDVSTRHMIELLTTARALLFATLGEGFGLPVIEAMRCACPVITSNLTSLPEVGGHAALYVDPNSTEEIAAMILRCFEDDELVASLRTAGLEQSKQFSWDATALATANVYRTVVGK